ncbi:Lipocalin-like domain-containing protein [Aspergillus alliaceus]|uniref:Lipocalin-like domain-containing protein n=1 Tax=Petromyces alliaceus TaxID=209559 RepID=UPI0012A623F3|nr:Lipocalin-like domain-containing protein [Aspergillus alliaceus]KAB8233912.1 Lipocalin-like domain-containing protein [Aspergillus alliaceus]
MPPVQSQLVGTWKLIEFKATRENDPSKTPIYPMGHGVQGMLQYSHDGYVSVHLMRSSADAAYITQDSPYQKYVAYAGRYEVDWNDKIILLRHYLTFCSYPDWAGSLQIRQAEFHGNYLTLQTVNPLQGEVHLSQYFKV